MEYALLVLLLVMVIICVVLGIMTTGIHIVRKGEIGFLYRGERFLRQFGPSFVVGPPIIGKMYRLDERALRITFGPSSPGRTYEGSAKNPRTEITLGIADPPRVPIRNADLSGEIRELVSETYRRATSRTRSWEEGNNPRELARELRTDLDRVLGKIGLRVTSLKVGDFLYDSTSTGLEGAGIPTWEDLSRRIG